MEDRLTEPSDVMLLYLPLAHNYGRLLHLSAAYIGYTIAFLPDPMRAATELVRVRPTLFPSVPRVYEKIHTAVVAGFEEQTGARKAIVDWAMRVGRRVSKLRQAKQPVPFGLALQHRIADRLVYAKVKERLGGRLRDRECGRCAALPRHRRVLPRDRHPDPRGLRPLRGDDGATVNRQERLQVRHGRQATPGRRDRDRRGRRDPAALEHRLRRLLPRRGGDARGARRRGLRPHGRRRAHRRGRLPRDHRPQEGHHRHGRRARTSPRRTSRTS